MSTTPEQTTAAVVIGLRDVYDQLVKLTSTVGDLRSDLRTVATTLTHTERRLDEQLTTHKNDDERKLTDHEIRLRSLERRLWVLAGAAAAVGTGGGLVASIISRAVTG